MDPLIQRELSKLDPSIPFRARPAHLHHTWARTFYSRPELYLQPESLAEIQKIVTLARRCRKRLVVVGSGHSPSDITCSSSWMLNLDKFNKIISITTRHDEVTMESGIRLHELALELKKLGVAMPNLGSIDEQSIAGAITTGTHGSSLKHGLMSQSIMALKIMLSNGQVVSCSAEKNTSLFRASLLSLGALGIIVEVSFRTVPAFNIHWEQSLRPLSAIIDTWNNDLWTSHEYVRVWWLPYLQRAIIWSADKTDLPLRDPPSNFYGGRLGYYVYHSLLTLSHYIPRLLPTVEWFVFGMQYGFRPGPHTTVSAVEPSHQGLLMNCLYSQFVNEWAIPLSKGPEAITRLSDWIHGSPEKAQIPYPSSGIYVHCPIEVRVSDTSASASNPYSSTPLNPNALNSRPYLDPTDPKEPTLYLNATLYRPYGLEPPCTGRYYAAFEYLMKDLGGRPHWAKNFTSDVNHKDFQDMYGEDLSSFNSVRTEHDPEGMFIGEFHRRTILPPAPSTTHPLASSTSDSAYLALEEGEVSRKPYPKGGILWSGARKTPNDLHITSDEKEAGRRKSGSKSFESRSSSPRTPTTSTSNESFDVLAKGEASVYVGGEADEDRGDESLELSGISRRGEGIVRG
jgi:D-arabinono-1,4-lactone oxidase